VIGRLYGKLLLKKPPFLLLDVAGVGYEVLASLTTCFSLPEEENMVTLYTHLAIREDMFQLYGFSNPSEKKLFQALIRVTGIGPKSALAILSSIEANTLVNAVLNEDVSALVRLPGIGKKTAQRLVMELQDKLKSWTQSGHKNESLSGTILSTGKQSMQEEAISALMALGYKPAEATKAVYKISGDFTSSEALIRQALQQSVKSAS